MQAEQDLSQLRCSAFPARGRRRFTFVAFTLAGALVVATAISAGAAAKPSVRLLARSHSSATVKPDFAYYKNKTITMIYWGSPGGAGDLQSRFICPYIGAYLHATCNVQDIAGGGTIPGQNAGADAAPNGLTIGELNPLGDVADFVNNTPGLNFNLRAMPLLPALPSYDLLMAATPGSGITSLKQLINETSPVSTIAEAGGSGVVYSQLFFGAYHIPNHFIYGYSSGAAELAGFARGDAQTLGQAFSVMESLILSHQATVLYHTTPEVKGAIGYSIMRKVPILSDFAKTNPPKTKAGKAELQLLLTAYAMGTFWDVPIGTPAKLQAALSAAMMFAESSGGALHNLEANGLAGGIVMPKTQKAEINYMIDHQAQLKTDLEETGPAPAH